MAQEIKLVEGGGFQCSVPYCLIFIWSRHFSLGRGREGREIPVKVMAAEACVAAHGYRV